MPGYTIKNGKSYFTFISGLEVEINPISPLEGNEIDQMFYSKRPKPPIQMVETADGADKVPEERKNDPAYIDALNQWEAEKEQAGRHLLIEQGINYELNSAQLAKVDQRRAYWKSKFDRDLDPDDKFVYFSFFELVSRDEYLRFADAVMGRSQPTEAAIAGALESFQG